MFGKQIRGRLSVLSGGLVAILASTTLGAVPPAQAAVDQPSIGWVDGATLTLTGSKAHDFVILQRKNGRLLAEFLYLGSKSVTTGVGCSVTGDPTARPLKIDCGKISPSISIDFVMGDGNDTVAFHRIAPWGRVEGGRGDDQLTLGEAKDDASRPVAHGVTFRGGTGRDTIDYGSADAGVNVTLGSTGKDINNDGRKNLDRDHITQVQDIVGTVYDDYLRGSPEDNMIYGKTGQDDISAGMGNDVVYAHGEGKPEDKINCGPGDGDIAYVYRASTHIPINCETVKPWFS